MPDIKPDWNYPPLPYLEQVSQHCPKATYTYIFLWQNMNKNLQFHIEPEKIPDQVLMSKYTFRHNVRLLAREGVLSSFEKPSGIYIELTGWEDE